MKILVTKERLTELLESQAAALTEHSVGFVLTHVESSVEGGSIGGSGTLVSIDGVNGILTAEHVVQNFRKRDKVGLVLTSYPSGIIHRFVFDPRHCRDISVSPVGSAEDGPDLSFLVLPHDATAALKAKKTFYNLSKRREILLGKPPSREEGIWTICGLAEEWTTDAPSQLGFENIKVFNGKLIGPLDAVEWCTRGTFDYVVFEFPYGDGCGYSGGGIWQLIIKPVNDVPTITSSYLIGVAYYQSDMMTRGTKTVRDILCHGHESIYQSLIDRVGAELVQ